jgi:hypothetical protein
MSDADPKRKALWVRRPRKMRAGGHCRKPHHGPLNVSCDNRCQERQRYHQECRTVNVHCPRIAFSTGLESVLICPARAEAPDCPGCRFVRRFEAEFEQLRERRDELVAELKRKLRHGRVIIIDIR